MTMQELLLKAPIELEAIADNMTGREKAEMLGELEGLLAGAAFIYGYIDMRYGSGCGDQGHDSAVKNANRVRITTRKVLGYSITHPIRV